MSYELLAINVLVSMGAVFLLSKKLSETRDKLKASEKKIDDYNSLPEGMKRVVKSVFTDENGDMTEQEFDADTFCKTEDAILIGKLDMYNSIIERSKHIMTYIDTVPIEESK